MGRKINYEQRTKIINTSFSLFLNYGYDEVTTRMIAEASGMTRALLFHYYNKKDALLLDVFLNIGQQAVKYNKRVLSEEQKDILDIGMFFRLFYEMMRVKPQYSNIYLPIFNDAELLNQLLMFIKNNHEFYGVGPYSKKKELAMFMVSGCLSQLVLLYEKNELDMTTSEVTDYAMHGYYFYLGLSRDEAQKLIDLSNEIIDDKYVRDFIEYYESNRLK